jgi:hypothetical protein
VPQISAAYARGIAHLPPADAFGATAGPDAPSLSDEDLTALALSADPDAPIPADAVALAPLSGVSPLPGWYMPAVTITRTRRWQRPVIYTVVSAFFIIEAFGLCSTFG